MTGSCSGERFDWLLRAPHISAKASFLRTRAVSTTKLRYVSAINTQKLINYVRDLKQRTISKRFYNMRVTNPENSLALTGFDNNGVSPLGMTVSLPIILSEPITLLKISLPVEDFVRATGCFIADLE